ncbi:MAG: DUF2188 domain-containing protein [Clostridia bacterium]|nr:DUF2188 domain-containing protein [Clostridia bacterium]
MRFLGFEDFISGYGIWILVGCLGLAFVLSVIFLFLNVNRVKKERLKEKKESAKKIKKEEKKLEEKKEIKVEKVKLTPAKTTKKPAAKKATKKTTVAKKTVATKKTSTPATKTTKAKPLIKEEGIYLVTFDKKTKEWAVKKSSSTRATKKFKTKEEAVKFANDISKK